MSDSRSKKYIELAAIDDMFLKYKLQNYFKQDCLDLREYPVEAIRKVFEKCVSNNYLDLSNLPDPLKSEIKQFLTNELSRLRPQLNTLSLNLIKPLKVAIDYMIYVGKNSIIDYSDMDLKTYREYLNTNFTGFCATTYYTILDRLQVFTIMYNERNIENVFQRSLWNPKEIKIASERVNPTVEQSFFCFYLIKNLDNRKIAQQYFEYLFTISDLAFGSIYKAYSLIKQFCLYFEDKSIAELSRVDALDYLDYLSEQVPNYDTYSKYVQAIIRFFNYISMVGLVKNHPFYSDDIQRRPYDFKETAIDDYVIFQMFNKLDTLPINIQNMYLINVCCGIRVSEICALKIGCLRKEKDYCMLRYYSIKMRKDCYILIPNSLYLRLKDWEKHRIEEDPKAIYMFPSIQNSKTTPFLQKQYRRTMNTFVNEWNITEQDGSLHIFHAHAYRHTLAKDLVDADVPIFVISQILSHSSVQMTLAYAEVRDEHKQKKFEQYVQNIKGLTEISKEEITAEWIRDNLKKQILPNGYCTLPCKLSCPHLNQCLYCDSFITTMDFYDVLKNQLDTLIVLLPKYQEKGMITKVATTEKEIKKLNEILEKLNEMEDN